MFPSGQHHYTDNIGTAHQYIVRFMSHGHGVATTMYSTLNNQYKYVNNKPTKLHDKPFLLRWRLGHLFFINNQGLECGRFACSAFFYLKILRWRTIFSVPYSPFPAEVSPQTVIIWDTDILKCIATIRFSQIAS